MSALPGMSPPPPGGAMPPSMGQPPQLPPSLQGPSRVGPVTAPQPHSGVASSGLVDVKNALEALQKALPAIPMGSDLHTAVLKAVTELSKHMPEVQPSPQMQTQGLMGQIRANAQNGPQAALASLMPKPPQAPAMPAAAAA